MRGHTYNLGSKCALLIYHLFLPSLYLFQENMKKKEEVKTKTLSEIESAFTYLCHLKSSYALLRASTLRTHYILQRREQQTSSLSDMRCLQPAAHTSLRKPADDIDRHPTIKVPSSSSP